jgi:Co/Zn/Cd efflux system component
MRDTGRVLLDAEMDAPVVNEVREIVRELQEPARLRDLHVWRIGRGRYACIVSLSGATTLQAADVRSALAVHEELVHVTVEFED